uniref:Metallothionein n=1 Tax=Physcomitrium patens TaxID=3218 RepID=A0A0F6MXJ0_PHYPA|nr:metallothionein [Physcomitrium patens]
MSGCGNSACCCGSDCQCSPGNCRCRTMDAPNFGDLRNYNAAYNWTINSKNFY